MFRLIASRLLLAGAVAALFSACSAEDTSQTSTLDPLSAGYALAQAGALALSAAQAAGLQMVALPDSGCSTSLLAPERVAELLNMLPEAQRTALITVLDVSAGVWTVQLYKGSQGTGICLPMQQILVLLPAAANATVDKISAAIPVGSTN